MDPETSADSTLAILDLSFAAGMDPDYAELHIVLDKKTGDVAVKSVSGADKPFDLAISAADMADALDAELDDAMPAADAPMVEAA